MEKIRSMQARLNHYLDLINANLGEMTDPDKYALGARFRFSTPMSILGKRQNADQDWRRVIKMLPQVQQLFKHELEKFIKLREGKSFFMPPLKRIVELRDGVFKIVYESPTQIVVDKKTPERYLLEYDISELYELLNGVPQASIRTCKNPQCGKLFIHISKKPQLYCSPSCAFKFLSKERRDRMKKKAA